MARTHAVVHALTGGAGTRGNAYLIEHRDLRILLDVGESADVDWLAGMDFEPDLSFVSHVHADHLGSLARFRESFPTARVLASPTTARLAARALAPLYGAARASALSDTIEPLQFHRPLQFEDLVVTLVPAGHIPGAAMIRLDYEGHSFLYTGDFSLQSRAWAAAVAPPEDIDFLLMEGALAGAQRLDSWDFAKASEEFRAWLGEGPGLVVVDALGLGPEMAALLGDGASVHETVYDESPCEPVDLHQARQVLANEGIVIAAGADLAADSIAGILAAELLEKSDARIALFNSLAAGSRAQRLASTSRRSRVLGWPNEPRLKARVRRFDWPLHATAPELIEFAKIVSPGSIYLVHGREDALYHLRRTLKKSTPVGEIEVLANGQPTGLWAVPD